MLVAAGANLNMRDANGQTPMMLAFQADDHDLATYLESMHVCYYYYYDLSQCCHQLEPEINPIGIYLQAKRKCCVRNSPKIYNRDDIKTIYTLYHIPIYLNVVYINYYATHESDAECSRGGKSKI